jgi:hypothetical protein
MSAPLKAVLRWLHRGARAGAWRQCGPCRSPGDQAEDLAVPQRAFADGVDGRVGGEAAVVDDDAAPVAHLQARLARQFVTRADAGGEDDHVGFQVRAVFEIHAMGVLLAIDDLDRVLLRMGGHAQFLDLLAQHAAAAFIDLHRHQARREFDHVGFQLQVAQGLGAFQAQQAAADHHAAPGRLPHSSIASRSSMVR